MSFASKKSKRNSTRNDEPTRPAKTSRRLPPPPPEDASETLRRLAERMEKRSSPVKVVANVPGEEKMSAVLGHFIEPYVHLTKTREAYEGLVTVAAVAWNTTLFSPEEGEELLRKTEKNLPKDSRQGFHDLVTEMMERKRRYFADNQWMILSYEITVLPGEYRLAVLSALPTEGKEKAIALITGLPATKPKKPSFLARILAFFRR